MWNLPQHTYEEIREVVVDILLRREGVTYDPNQFGHLITGAVRRSASPLTRSLRCASASTSARERAGRGQEGAVASC